LIVFEKAEKNYSAYSPDLPGCVATGSNRKEVEKNIKEAIEFHIDGMKEEGQKPPKPTSFTEFVEV
jgi:predicted RNase H-like HicB family nuclease